MSQERKDIWDAMWKVSPAENLWNNYNDPFAYGDIEKSINDIFGGYEEKIGRNVSSDISKATGDQASRFASRGILGGSVVDDTMSGISSDINEKKYNALSDLGIGKASSVMDLKNLFNKLGLQKNTLKQGQENAIFGQGLAKTQNLGSFLSDWEQFNLQQENQGGFWEDLMSGVGDIAGLIPGVGTGVSFLSKLLAGGGGSSRKPSAMPG